MHQSAARSRPGVSAGERRVIRRAATRDPVIQITTRALPRSCCHPERCEGAVSTKNSGSQRRPESFYISVRYQRAMLYGRIQGMSRKISASVLYTRFCRAGAGAGRVIGAGACSTVGSATTGDGSVVTDFCSGAGAGACRSATRTVGRGERVGVRFCAARVGVERGPPSIAETTTCDRDAVGANSRPPPLAAARSRLRPSSATGPLLLHAVPPIKAAIAAIRLTLPYENAIESSANN